MSEDLRAEVERRLGDAIAGGYDVRIIASQLTPVFIRVRAEEIEHLRALVQAEMAVAAKQAVNAPTSSARRRWGSIRYAYGRVLVMCREAADDRG